MKSGNSMIEADGVQSASDPLNSIDTPSITVTNYNNQYNDMYDQLSLVVTPLYTLSKNHQDVIKFTDGMKCAICHQLYFLEKCPILGDIPYIKKHFISYCLQMNKTQKQMITAIHLIDATWGTDNHNHDDNDYDYNFLNTNTDNDADFQEEEE